MLGLREMQVLPDLGEGEGVLVYHLCHPTQSQLVTGLIIMDKVVVEATVVVVGMLEKLLQSPAHLLAVLEVLGVLEVVVLVQPTMGLLRLIVSLL